MKIGGDQRAETRTVVVVIDLSRILHELSASELARIAKLAGVEARNAEARRGALADHDIETIVEQLSTERLRVISRKHRLHPRGRSRRALVAAFVGREHELRGAEPYRTWLERMETFVHQARPESYLLRVQPPAKEREVREAERRLGIRFPDGFRATLRRFTRQLDYYWFVDDPGEGPPGWRDAPYCGNCSFGLESLQHSSHPVHFSAAERSKPSSMWAWRLVVVGDGSGNGVALDLRGDGRAIWMNHEDSSPPHGARLGNDFIDFMDRFTRIGCLGPEMHQIHPLVGTRGIRKSGTELSRYLKWARTRSTKPR